MALQYLLPCKCGQQTPFSESLAGTYITCQCGRSVRVPPRSQLYRLQLAPLPEKASVAPVKEYVAPVKESAAIAAPSGDRGVELPLVAEIVPDTCVACGAQLPAQARYCWLCGAKYLGPPPLKVAKAESGGTSPPLSSGQSGLAWLAVFVAALVGFGAVSTQDSVLIGLYLIVAVPTVLVAFAGSVSARKRGAPWSPGKAVSVAATTAATTVLTVSMIAIAATVIAAVTALATMIALFALCAALLGGGS